MLTTSVPISGEAGAGQGHDAVGALLEGASGPGDAPPCHRDPDLWFAESPQELERAKAQCEQCPIKAECLAGALSRGEPWGVWGGEILERGTVIARKRPRGRPRKHTTGPTGTPAPTNQERAA